ncbi:hypothetical protein I7I48_08569 [Histoplasma ohiense]|nr:hypothetical protein I7I48_08569 [Histoplasma ohiense (nom. inval.)]
MYSACTVQLVYPRPLQALELSRHMRRECLSRLRKSSISKSGRLDEQTSHLMQTSLFCWPGHSTKTQRILCDEPRRRAFSFFSFLLL